MRQLAEGIRCFASPQARGPKDSSEDGGWIEAVKTPAEEGASRKVGLPSRPIERVSQREREEPGQHEGRDRLLCGASQRRQEFCRSRHHGRRVHRFRRHGSPASLVDGKVVGRRGSTASDVSTTVTRSAPFTSETFPGRVSVNLAQQIPYPSSRAVFEHDERGRLPKSLTRPQTSLNVVMRHGRSVIHHRHGAHVLGLDHRPARCCWLASPPGDGSPTFC